MLFLPSILLGYCCYHSSPFLIQTPKPSSPKNHKKAFFVPSYQPFLSVLKKKLKKKKVKTRVHAAKKNERGFYFGASPKNARKGSGSEKNDVEDMVNAYVDIICEDFKNIGKEGE